MKQKTTSRLFMSLLLGSSLALGGVGLTPAIAGVGAVKGGSGANSTSNRPMQWESWGFPGQTGSKSAFQRMIKDIGARGNGTSNSKDFILKQANKIPKNAKGKSGLWQCANSDYVWAVTWYRSSIATGMVASAGQTYGRGWEGQGTIQVPHVTHGTAPSDKSYNEFVQWDKFENGNSLKDDPVYTLICSYGFDDGQFVPGGGDTPGGSTPPKTHPDKHRSVSTPISNTTQATVPYTGVTACKVEVKRQISGAGGNDPIGKDNLQDQGGTPITSAFGRLYNAALTGKTNASWTGAQWATQVTNALKTDKTMDCSSVTLNEANKQGMAEGGVLNMVQQKTSGTINVTTATTSSATKVCDYVTKWDTAKNAYGPEKLVSCNTVKGATTNKVAKVEAGLGTPANTGFWQLLSVHCNPAQLKQLVTATGATVVSSDPSDGALTSIIKSKKYASQPTANLDFGDKYNSNKTKAASGNLSFYNKECPVDCTPLKTGSGASALNGAKSNVNDANATKVNQGKYGAVSGTTNTNKFEFFRDNKAHAINVDVWYPVTTNLVSYDGAAPLSTTVTRWAQGTPSIDGSSGGVFAMSTADGKTKLFTGTAAAKANKNWDVSEWNNSTSVLMKGLKRSFAVKANWASDTNRPQVLNFKWEYAPTVATSFPATLGFDKTGALLATGTVTQGASVQAKCVAAFGTTSTIKSQPVTTDGTLMNAPAGTTLTGADWNNANSLFVNFVRATGE